MQQALYAPDGFYQRGGNAPQAHFRTSVHASPHFARALVRLLTDLDRDLGRPDPLHVVDVGAGGAELLQEIHRTVTDTDSAHTDLADRLRLVAVEVAPRPRDLAASIQWRADPPEHLIGLLIANEWLDNVPLDVVEREGDQWRLVMVDPGDGREELGPTPDAAALQWLDTWWPAGEATDGDRAEVGLLRDVAWGAAVGAVDRGVAIAVDYAHGRGDRAAGQWSTGTLTGFRGGRELAPVPNGTCDITAHVALDACAEAGRRAGMSATQLTSQRTALLALGLDRRRPPISLATSDPRTYLRQLAAASEVAELIDPVGLGSFQWLIQARGLEVPALLSDPLPA